MGCVRTTAMWGWGEREGREEDQFYAARDTHWPGTVLFSRRSACNGEVRVVQWGERWRSLDFNGVSQGIVKVTGSNPGGGAAPEVLASQYLRVMAAAALGYGALNGLDPAGPNARFVFAGLGAGQLPHFLAHHFPAADVVVAEICPVVLEANAVLRGETVEDVPDSNPDAGGVRTTIADAAAAMRSLERSRAACAVFLDAYDGEGDVPEHLTSSAFLGSCARNLAPGGVVAANLYNGAPGSEARAAVARVAGRMRENVGPVVSIGVDSSGGENVVLVAGKGVHHASRGERGPIGEGHAGGGGAGEERRAVDVDVAATDWTARPVGRIGRNGLGTAAGEVAARAGFAWSAEDAMELVKELYWVEVNADGSGFRELAAMDSGGGTNARGAFGQVMRALRGTGGATDGTASKTLYVDS